jgi:hypothetical protein
VSARYECGTAGTTEISVLSGRPAAEAEVLTRQEIRRGEHALIIGDPWASAYAITGTPAELRAFVDKLARQVDILAGPRG